MKLAGNFYQLAFFAFYVDEQEKQELQILEEMEENSSEEDLQKRLLESSIVQEAFGKSGDGAAQTFDENEKKEIMQFLRVKQYLRRVQRGRIFGKTFMLYVLQMALSVILFKYFNRSGLYFPSYATTLISAYIVVIILHLFMQPGVFKSIECMKYLFTHSENFEQTFIPFCTCMMKLSVEICVEITNILTGFQLNDELWIIMCYTAICCISEMDEQYYEIADDKLKTRLEHELDYDLPLKREIRTDISLLYSKESKLSFF